MKKSEIKAVYTRMSTKALIAKAGKGGLSHKHAHELATILDRRLTPSVGLIQKKAA